jgi:superfamily II DNA or RNA helicase/diadenosine tetraphosphate (Ap4A) HIT family hydrolase/HKD family nuclease
MSERWASMGSCTPMAEERHREVRAKESPFLRARESEWVASNACAFALRDLHPVNPGHTLVIPRRPVGSWWELTESERHGMWELVDVVKEQLDQTNRPDGYNIGFNAGTAAGQTVEHLHVHVIPRYVGDMVDPRGGVRHVIPGKGNYLDPESSEPRLVDGRDRLLKLELLRCLRNPTFDRIDLLVSFIMKSGLQLLGGALEDAVERGAMLRVLTTDYLQVTDSDALARLLDLADVFPERVSTRVFSDPATSFHPKAYLFWSTQADVAAGFVGSSNLSFSGISSGVEWNVGLDCLAPLLRSFETLWSDPRARPLSPDWLQQYRERRPPEPAVVQLEVEREPPAQPAQPRPVQQEALTALEQTRIAGFDRGLVVMATGLGKTWVAAFDSTRPEFRRVLFIAHREEILRQARDVYRQVRPDADLGLFTGSDKDPGRQVVFASVQTLARNLSRFAADAFDYMVVDEFHHAAARSYRNVLDHLQPKFLLGLTATPDRLDGADLLALCGDNLVFERDLLAGIRGGDLVPFRYWGVPDVVDFEPIPWRSGRFDPQALSEAVETRERAAQALQEWQERGGGRTLAFCVSVTHADFMAEYFAEHGVRAVAVHTGPGSAPRTQALEDLRSGDLDVVFSVDIFNEGVDVPAIDTVLMLRPTESPVIFLQQLGRGLRKHPGKDHLRVVDLIGNHRSFLLKPRVLLGLSSATAPSTRRVLDAMRDDGFDLPPGCSVHFDLEVVEMLDRLAKVGRRAAIEDYCRSHYAETGQRPTAAQVHRAGLNPASVRAAHGGWFGFLDHLGLLGEQEVEVLRRHGDVLDGFEREPVTKAYKLVTLQALLSDGTLRSGASITQVAWTSHRIVAGDPRLVADARSKELSDPEAADPSRWRDYWRRWPLAAWAGELKGQPGKWFRIDGEGFVPTFDVHDDVADTFDAMVAELVDYRLARHLLGQQRDPGVIRCKVSHAGGRPIIRLDRPRHSELPEGKGIPFVADGTDATAAAKDW